MHHGGDELDPLRRDTAFEQRPRAQSKATAILPARGEALIFTNRERPVRGNRGFYATQMRHGASVVSSGQRFVLGIIFHDAQ
jgi:hypothetical protein